MWCPGGDSEVQWCWCSPHIMPSKSLIQGSFLRINEGLCKLGFSMLNSSFFCNHTLAFPSYIAACHSDRFLEDPLQAPQKKYPHRKKMSSATFSLREKCGAFFWAGECKAGLGHFWGKILRHKKLGQSGVDSSCICQRCFHVAVSNAKLNCRFDGLHTSFLQHSSLGSNCQHLPGFSLISHL